MIPYYTCLAQSTLASPADCQSIGFPLTVYTRFTNTTSRKHPRAIMHSKQE
jgi:hypothetical protein